MKLSYVIQGTKNMEVLSVTMSLGKTVANLQELLFDYHLTSFQVSAWDGFEEVGFCVVKLHPDACLNTRQMKKQVNRNSVESAMDESSTILVV